MGKEFVMNYDLKDKVVAIAGGTTGIGEALAIAYAKQGCKVAVCGRRPEKIEEIKSEFEELGHEILAVRADLAVNDDIRRFADTVAEHYGRIDVWINNAGINIQAPFNKLTEEQWHEVVNINFKSVFFGSAIVSDIMKRQRIKGVIINTSSFNQIMPTAGRAIYCATKAAIESMTRVFAVELGKFDIRVLAVAPGYTITRLTEWEIESKFEEFVSAVPVKRLATVDDMVAAYLFLSSDAANYINGVTVPVTGGKYGTQNPLWSWEQPEETL